MKVTFAGGAGSIGASCILLEVGSSSIVIDCGSRPGERKSPLPDLSVLTGKTPCAIILTHAHTDHSGALPVLAEYFPHTPIFATPPTIDLVRILFKDSLKIMNSTEREGDIPLFNSRQVEQVLENFVPLPHNEPRTIDPFVCTFYPAGHILGASMVHLATPDGYVLISGDYSCSSQRTVGAMCKPEQPVDLLISESTYGERLHEDRSVAERRLIEQVKEIVTHGGRVLIPSFAIGRAQEVILILRKAMRDKRLEPVSVYVDGMVKAVCDVYSRHEHYVTNALAHDIRSLRHPFFTDQIVPVETVAQRSQILQAGPSVIVASSGMLNGGASVFYAKEILKNERDGILLTGYQDEESPGRALLDLAGQSLENRHFTLAGEEINVKSSVSLFGLSAHADRMEMAGFIESMRPRTVVLVHGSNEAREGLKSSISCNDCLSGYDGLVIERKYSLRHTLSSVENYTMPTVADIDRVRAILGPPTHVPVKGSHVADIWFGRRVPPLHIERFISTLIDLGLIRRDDEKSYLIRVLSPLQTDTLQDESLAFQQLKVENPKGKLLEHCMKCKMPYPSTEWGIDGGFHTARMTILVDSTVFDSGTHRAADRLFAEQFAAKQLLEKWIEHDLLQMDDIINIADSDTAILKSRNPKGRLIELLMKRSLLSPQFDMRAVGGFWCCRAIVVTECKKIISKWYQNANKTIAQQGAAAELLTIDFEKKSLHDEVLAPEKQVESSLSDIQIGADPRITLNVLRQRNYIIDFGYTPVERTGLAHAPVFSAQAWAQLPDQKKIASQAQKGNSKKEAEFQAARDLVGIISQLGI